MPASLQWFFSIIGLVAFIMAQPITQVIWGRPHLVVAFQIGGNTDEMILECIIWNAPTRNKILRFLRVKTDTIEKLGVQFEILNQKMESIGKPIIGMIKTQQGQIGEYASIPASTKPSIVPILAHNKELVSCFVMDYSKKQAIKLNGIYLVKVTVYYENYKREIIQKVYAGNHPPYINLLEKLSENSGVIISGEKQNGDY
jgi:hypothetical protein